MSPPEKAGHSMRVTLPFSRSVIAALAASVVLAVVGVVIVAVSLGTSAGHQSASHQQVSSSSGAQPGPIAKASLRIPGLHHGRLPYAKILHVQVANATLSAVTISQPGMGVLAGTFNKTRTRWHSASPLAPSSDLRATLRYVDLKQHARTKTFTIRTAAVAHHFNALLSPGGGDTVGVGSPVVVTFDQAIPTDRRAAVERGLTVTATPAVVGAWHWMSDQEVHWRPPTYWKTGTKVTISSDLQGVDLGHGVWGAVGRHSTSFKIGASHISEVNQATHEMQVFDNGKLIKTFPVSTGREQYPTMDGVHIAIEKSQVVQMDSATVGIPKSSPGYYNETVYWDVRISDGGEFVHAAPWSVGEQGHINVSHGCVNLSTENAEWFYNWAQTGDVVDVYGGVRPPEPGDPGTADWNMSWKQWLAGDAAPTAAAKALHVGTPRSSEPGFGPKVHVAKKAHGHHHSASKHGASKHGASKHGAKKSAGSSWG
jgi:lipoprotein-anchoring transpeptidase ErfK/SrfK